MPNRESAVGVLAVPIYVFELNSFFGHISNMKTRPNFGPLPSAVDASLEQYDSIPLSPS